MLDEPALSSRNVLDPVNTYAVMKRLSFQLFMRSRLESKVSSDFPELQKLLKSR